MADPTTGKRTAPPTETDLVWLGPIVNAHGIRGEVRVLPHNPDTTALRAGVDVILDQSGRRRPLRVTAARPHKNFLLVTFEGVADRTAAEAIIGAEVGVPRTELPPLDEGEVYHYQLVGLRVVTTGGEEIGEITEVFSTAANDVCVVRAGEREVLVPLVNAVVQSIDVEGGVMVIEALPGLL